MSQRLAKTRLRRLENRSALSTAFRHAKRQMSAEPGAWIRLRRYPPYRLRARQAAITNRAASTAINGSQPACSQT